MSATLTLVVPLLGYVSLSSVEVDPRDPLQLEPRDEIVLMAREGVNSPTPAQKGLPDWEPGDYHHVGDNELFPIQENLERDPSVEVWDPEADTPPETPEPEADVDEPKKRSFLGFNIGRKADKEAEDGISIHIDLSSRVLVVKKNGWPIRRYTGIEWARKGVGHKLNSKQTPTGRFEAILEPDHRFGPTIRLSGYQGWTRGILIHPDNTRDDGSNGCIHLKWKEMEELLELTPEGAPIHIKK